MNKWKYKYASNMQLEKAWSQDDIREAFQHDLGFTTPRKFTYPNETGNSHFSVYPYAKGRKRFLASGVCHWTVRGNLAMARYLWPNIKWIAIEGNWTEDGHHSTVIAPLEKFVFDPYFQFIKITADEAVSDAKTGKWVYSENPVGADDDYESIGYTKDFHLILEACPKNELRSKFSAV